MFFLLVVCTAVLLCVRSGVQCEPLCLSDDFDSQLQHILRQEMMSAQETADILSQVLGDVQRTLNQRWQGFKLTPYGSSTAGFWTKTSDLDISLQFPNCNSSADSYVLQEAKMLFVDQPALYSKLKSEDMPKFIFVSFIHIPTQRNVDLAFRNGEGAVNSKLVKYYIHLDKRFQPLGAFLKMWFKIHGLTGHGPGTRALPNYGLYLLTIFYLQQKNMVPPAYILQKGMFSHFSHIWNLGFSELPYRSENTKSLHELLGGFFKYYSEFNFEKYIVSPFAGRPIPRNAFIDINNFPKEYTINKHTSTLMTQFEIRNNLNISTDVCIQDVFVHDSNVAKRVSRELATKFKYLMKTVATMFKDLPRDNVLRAILVMDQHKETDINHNSSIVARINEQDFIEITDCQPFRLKNRNINYWCDTHTQTTYVRSL